MNTKENKEQRDDFGGYSPLALLLRQNPREGKLILEGYSEDEKLALIVEALDSVVGKNPHPGAKRSGAPIAEDLCALARDVSPKGLKTIALHNMRYISYMVGLQSKEFGDFVSTEFFSPTKPESWTDGALADVFPYLTYKPLELSCVALSERGALLQYIDKKEHSNRLVKTALYQDPRALRYAAYPHEPDWVQTAVRADPKAVWMASPVEPAVVKSAYERDIFAFPHYEYDGEVAARAVLEDAYRAKKWNPNRWSVHPDDVQALSALNPAAYGAWVTEEQTPEFVSRVRAACLMWGMVPTYAETMGFTRSELKQLLQPVKGLKETMEARRSLREKLGRQGFPAFWSPTDEGLAGFVEEYPEYEYLLHATPTEEVKEGYRARCLEVGFFPEEAHKLGFTTDELFTFLTHPKLIELQKLAVFENMSADGVLRLVEEDKLGSVPFGTAGWGYRLPDGFMAVVTDGTPDQQFKVVSALLTTLGWDTDFIARLVRQIPTETWRMVLQREGRLLRYLPDDVQTEDLVGIALETDPRVVGYARVWTSALQKKYNGLVTVN